MADVSGSSSASAPPRRLRIISLNCWGLKYLAAHRQARLDEIGARLAAADPQPDIVGLQECWTQQDYEAIRAHTRHILPYGKFYFSGIFGGGLVILSRWPIEESNMLRYPLNGRPAAFYRGDWFVGKGVACARIRMGPGKRDVAEVFCTHLHAPYETEPYDSYLCHRTAQAWEIAKLMRHASERGHLVIGLGDFNMRPVSLAHQLIEAHSPARDVWRVLHPTSSLGAAKDAVEKKRGVPIPTAAFNLTENGATCDSALNTWRWEESLRKRLSKGEEVVVEDTVPDPNAKRLDYIFISSGPHPLQASDSPSARPYEWSLSSVNVGMTARHPTLRCSLSDHFSIEATLVRTPPSASLDAADNTSPPTPAPVSDPDPETLLPAPTYAEILDMADVYAAREFRQRRLRIAHFFAQLLVTIACLVAVWWAPRPFVAFVLMLVSSLGLAAGVVDGLMGFLFVGSEERALKEFRWEVARAKERADGLEGYEGNRKDGAIVS